MHSTRSFHLFTRFSIPVAVFLFLAAVVVLLAASCGGDEPASPGGDAAPQATSEAKSRGEVISAGYSNTCWVRADGSVACWGKDNLGQSSPPRGEFVSVSVGRGHTCGVRDNGSAACWGHNFNDDYGQSIPPAGEFVSIDAGDWHNCGVRTDGTVTCWGADGYGQSSPPPGKFTSVSAAYHHTCGLRDDATIACWGEDDDGESTPPQGEFSSVSAGYSFTCGVRNDGSIDCWGDDDHGRATPPEGEFASVSAGYDHACGVRPDSSVACWGDDVRGQSTPPQGKFASVSAGSIHTCGVKSDGSAACWGDDDDGRTTPPRTTRGAAVPTRAPAATAAPQPTEAPLASQEGLRIAGPCTSDILKEGVFTGIWRDGCPLDVSDWSKGFAHYYRFRIADTSLVVIELAAHASDAAAGLALLQGEVGNESVLAFNSDIGFARMQVQLAPGEYTIEAKATRQVVGNPYFDLHFDLPDTATEAPFEEEAILKYEGICTSSFQSEGAVRSEWIENCFSYGSSLNYAYYYAFRINLPTTISIELTSGENAQLLLLQGPVGAWDELESYASGNSGRIEFITHLPAGEYVIEVASDYLANYELSIDLEDSPPSPTSAPQPTPAPAPTAAPGEPATLEEYAAMVAGGAGAIYVGDLTQLAGPAPYHDDKLGDDDGMVPLEALERHRWIYESDYYQSLLDRANLANPSPLTSSGESIWLQFACINRALPPCLLLEGFLAPVLEAGTNGQLTPLVISFRELGLAGPDTLSLLRDGTLSAATVYGGYVSHELPQFGIQNLWGLYSSPEQAFEASQAIIKDIDRLVLAETGGFIMNHSWHAGDQFMFCRERIDTPDDFEGRIIRSDAAAMSDWLNGMGADAQFLSFAEVYTALERSILDCAVASADAAYSQRWYEVTDYIIGPLPSFSFSPNVINAGVWRSIPHDLQQILIEYAAMSELEALRLAAVQNEVGLPRNIDAGLEFIPFSDEMNRRSLESAMNSVIPNWVDRVGGPDALIVTDTFNNKVGPIVGLRIQPNGEVVKTN